MTSILQIRVKISYFSIQFLIFLFLIFYFSVLFSITVTMVMTFWGIFPSFYFFSFTLSSCVVYFYLFSPVHLNFTDLELGYTYLSYIYTFSLEKETSFERLHMMLSLCSGLLQVRDDLKHKFTDYPKSYNSHQ